MQHGQGHARWGLALALTLALGGCSLIGGVSPSPSTSGASSGGDRGGRATPGQADSTPGMSVQTFAQPTQGRDWVVLVKDPADTAKVADSLRQEDLALTSINAGVGMVTLRSTQKDVARIVEGIDGVEHAVTDRDLGWSPDAPRAPQPGDSAPAGKQVRPPDPPRGGDPLDGWLWGLAEINADEAHSKTQGRRDVRVGVVDTGVDAKHPDIAPNFDSKGSRTFVTDIPDIDGECEHDGCVDPVGTDGGGHGTHVAGTIAAAANDIGVRGVAPKVSIVDLRAGQDDGLFLLGPTVNAITHGADQRLDVMNMSFYVDPWLYACRGGASQDTPEQATAQDVAIELVHRAVERAHDRGVTLISAAGNNAHDLADPGTDTSSPNYGDEPHKRTIDPKTCESLPTDSPHVIGVSSIDKDGSLSDFSNWTSDPSSDDVAVAAPGGQGEGATGRGILSTYPRELLQSEGSVDDEGRITESGAQAGVVRHCPQGVTDGESDPKETCGYYTWLQGTSMAAPHASGVAALIISAKGERTAPDEVVEVLRASAQDLTCPTGSTDGQPICSGTEKRNGFFGDGVINAEEAID